MKKAEDATAPHIVVLAKIAQVVNTVPRMVGVAVFVVEAVVKQLPRTKRIHQVHTLPIIVQKLTQKETIH
mgnify:CR=1 FL=1